MSSAILQALRGQPAPPCDIYRCIHQMECTVHSKACMAFYRYVTSAAGRFPGSAIFREPSDFYYDKVFQGAA